MPTFEFTSPEGRTYEVDGPDGATPAQAFSVLQAQLKAAPAPARGAPSRPDDSPPLGDPMGSGDAAAILNAPAPRQSVLEGVQLPEPVVTDAQEAQNNLLSRRAYAEGTPTVDDPRMLAPVMSATPQPAPVAKRAPAPSSGSLAKDLAVNAFAGGAKTLVGAGATAADVVGAHAAAASMDEIRHNWEGVQKEYGGDTITGHAADLVGAVAPALLVPATLAAQLVGNAGLFAVPAFRDTLKAQLDAGRSFPLALAHAAEAFGINLFLPTVATRGSSAIAKALGAEGGSAARQVGTAVGQAAGEGAAFSVASSALDKGTDVLAGERNDRDWIDLQDVAANALGFSVLRGAHMLPRAASAVNDRVGSASRQFGRALQQDIDNRAPGLPAHEIAGLMVGETLNPNLANVGPTNAPDPITRIAKAPTVDAAIQAAQELVDSTAPTAPAQSPNKTLEQELADLRQRTAGTDSVADEIRSIRPTSPVDAGEVGESGNEAAAPEITQSAADAAAAGIRPGVEVSGDTIAGIRNSELIPVHDEPAAQAGTEAVEKGGLALADQGQTNAADLLHPELAQTPADAGVSASGVRPYQVERSDSGSLVVRGDKATIREALANLPPNAMVPTRDGIQVATTWSDRAERVLQAFDPAAYSDFNGKKVAIKVEAEDGTQATLKLDAGRALRATDARERELQRLRECVGGRA